MDVTAALERAVAQLEPGGEIVDVRRLTGGVSAEVVRLDIATSTGTRRQVVFRRHQVDGFKQHAQTVTAKEYGLLAALHRAGFAVPEPYLYSDTDATTGQYLLLEWIDGSTDIAVKDLPTALDQMARFLVDLHAVDPSSLPLPELERIEDPLTAIGPYLPPTEAGDRVRNALAARVLEDEPSVSVLHGDYWPGNVMWRDGRLVAVVDWEDACIGDRLADLATARVELLCQHGEAAMDQITDRYLALTAEVSGPLAIDRLVVWDLYVSATALSGMDDWGLEPAEEARRRRLTEGFFDRSARALTQPGISTTGRTDGRQGRASRAAG